MKLSDIITPVNTKFGAPMGRMNVGRQPETVTSGRNNRIVKKNQVRVYEKRVPLVDGYDQGGAYWGVGPQLRVRFTKDLSYIEFFRVTEIDEYTFPSIWASYLINADPSGLEDSDIALCDESTNGLGSCVGVSDESHFGRFKGIGYDLSEYKFRKS